MLKTIAFAAFAGALSLSASLLAPGTATAAPAAAGLALPAQAATEAQAALVDKVGYRRHGGYRRAHYRRPVYYGRGYYRPRYYRPAYVAPVYYGNRCRIIRQQVWNGWGYVWQPVRVCRRYW
jgi:hypothetical protein